MYQDLSYWGNHKMLKDKFQTYSVEGGNADIRHYLAILRFFIFTTNGD
jgi:IS1 family transposase